MRLVPVYDLRPTRAAVADEALRLAQIDLIHSANFARPVHWAAFELIGDWK